MVSLTPARPATLVRSLKAQRVIEAAHPAYDHFLVWMFAVSPNRQRQGLGQILMREALTKADSAEVPASNRVLPRCRRR
jgi:ribosomal protein S18 acetylase RimI-like enzyme